MYAGAVMRRVQVPSRVGHDMVRAGDRVYVCSTGDGSILELSYPDMQLVRHHHYLQLQALTTLNQVCLANDAPTINDRSGTDRHVACDLRTNILLAMLPGA